MAIATEGQLQIDFVQCEVVRIARNVKPNVDFAILPAGQSSGILLEIKDPAGTPEHFRDRNIPGFIEDKLEGTEYVTVQFQKACRLSHAWLVARHPDREGYAFIGLFGVEGLDVFGFRPVLQALQIRLIRHWWRHRAELPFLTDALIITDTDWKRLYPEWPLTRF
jgi:hypothetical protein